MEEQLNLVSKLSLSEMALRRVVINLWNESDIPAEIEGETNFTWKARNSFEPKFSNEVEKKVSKLLLPELLKKRMLDVAEPLRIEISKWQWLHNNFFIRITHKKFDMNIYEQLCWTCTGAIDYRKTAEKLVRLKTLDIEKRYRLACFYCLEDCIPELWMDLPEKYKSRFNDDVHPSLYNTYYLEYYWASVLKGEEFRLNDIVPGEFVNTSSTYQSLFTYSACKGSKAATKYFFQKFTDQERSSALFRIVCDAFERFKTAHWLSYDVQLDLRSDVLLYLLSLLNREEQMQILKQHPSICLKCFLDWPWQDLLLDIADTIWNFLPEDHYDAVLERLFHNVFIFGTGYYLPELFRNFFMRSPVDFKKRYVDCEIDSRRWFLSEFLKAEDIETIKVVWGNVESSDRIRLLSDVHLYSLFFLMIRQGAGHLVKLCIDAAKLPKEARMIIKRSYMTSDLRDRTTYEFKLILEMLDGIGVSTYSTKGSRIEALTQAKRPSSEEEKKCNVLLKKLKRH
ncbi:unnamed protein product [Larinioides sclopetarius]|uniref:Uncharacterized protein n=1 Tax=Larinioides sclopetarius TaxID=280406 RepID=A0AAV2AQK6_9ARAC